MDQKSREKATAAVSEYNRRVAQIRADDRLSNKGKRDALESAFETAKAITAKLRSESEKSAESRQQALRRELFGLPFGASDTVIVSSRDAVDRVAQAKSPEALGELMERAAVTGDESLLRAAFARAWQQGRNPLGSAAKWNGLVDEYARQRPAVKGPLEELEQLSSSAGQTAEFAERMATTPNPPPELRVSA